MDKAIHIDNNYSLSLNESSNITLFIDDDANINYELSNGVYNLLVFNNSSKDISLNEEGNIKNAEVNITYLDVNDTCFSQTNKFNVYTNSSLSINSIYLGINTKSIAYDLFNRESNSNVTINNSVVCLNDAIFELNVIGNIIKGAKNSKCLQTNKCLTFEVPKKAKVLPVLNIDENDIEAKHSLSSGTIDEEVLFYMNSRGLTKKESLHLLLTSYLMPNDDLYSKFIEGSLIQEKAIKKVNETCSM